MFRSRAPRFPRTNPHHAARTPLRSRAVRVLAAALAVPALLASTAGTAAAHEAVPASHDHVTGSAIATHDGAGAQSPAESRIPPGPQGIDVSAWQGSIDWEAVYDAGIRFSYIKATEGTSYTDPRFDENYTNAHQAGLIRGAYHFARPDISSGAAQARFLVDNGGGWRADGVTLPPLIDIEHNPYGTVCYGKSHSGMVSWLRDFSSTVKSLTGRYPAIYTTTGWWKQCTGDSGAFGGTNALVIGHWGDTVGELPNWPTWTIWQYGSSDDVPGVDGTVGRSVFHGDMSQLKAFARCTEEDPC